MTWEELNTTLVEIRKQKHEAVTAFGGSKDSIDFWYAKGQYEEVIELHVTLKEKYGPRT